MTAPQQPVVGETRIPVLRGDEMNEMPICPLRMIAAQSETIARVLNNYPGNPHAVADACLQSQCAWWVAEAGNDQGMCALSALARCVQGIAEAQAH